MVLPVVDPRLAHHRADHLGDLVELPAELGELRVGDARPDPEVGQFLEVGAQGLPDQTEPGAVGLLRIGHPRMDSAPARCIRPAGRAGC